MRKFLATLARILFQIGNFELLTVGNTVYCHHFFAKILWNQLFAKELYSKLIWRKKFAWQWISRFSTLCTLWCCKMNSLVISLVKAMVSRNFCQKSVRANFCNYHTVCPWLYMSFENCPWLYVHDFWKFVFTVLFHDSRVFKCFMQKLNFTKIESL